MHPKKRKLSSCFHVIRQKQPLRVGSTNFCKSLDAQEISKSADASGTMIVLHRLNGQPLVVNVFHIVSIERTPDTLLTLFGGDKLLVAESLDEVVIRFQAFMQHIGRVPLSAPPAQQDV
jgi:flagellar protein FlbD